MRKLLVVLLALTMIGCNIEDNIRLSNTGELLKGKHILRKFRVKTTKEKRWSGSYFLIGGSAGGGTYTSTDVSFSFQLPDSSYAMATLPFQSIRVKLDSTITKPYVTFKWDRSRTDNIQSIMKWNVKHMVVHCKEEDFPMDVQINQL